jgi:hypothetical protein
MPLLTARISSQMWVPGVERTQETVNRTAR